MRTITLIIQALRNLTQGNLELYLKYGLLSIILSCAIFTWIRFDKVRPVFEWKPTPRNLNIIGLALSVFVFGFLFAWMYLRHLNFMTHGLDLGLFIQSLWYNTNFSYPISSIRGFNNLWGDHFTPFFVLLVPFAWIFGADNVILVLQPLFIAWGTFIVFKYTSNKINFWSGLVLAFAYFSFLGHQNALSFDFHPIVLFSPIFILLIINFFLEASINWKHVIPLSLFAILLQEDVSVILAYVFAVALLFKLLPKLVKVNFKSWLNTKQDLKKIALDRKFWFLCSIPIIAFVYFTLAKSLIIEPNAPKDGYLYFNYPALGGNFKEAIKSILLHPGDVIYAMTTPVDKVKAFWEFTYSSGFTYFFSPAAIVLSIMPFMVKFLNAGNFIYTNSFHYTAYHFGISFLGFMHVFKLIDNRPQFKYLFTLYILFTALFSAYISDNYPYQRLSDQVRYSNSDIEVINYLKTLDKNKSILASNDIIPHIAMRTKVQVACHRDFKTYKPMTEFDYVAIFRSNEGSFPCQPYELDGLRNDPKYKEIFKNDEIQVFEKM